MRRYLFALPLLLVAMPAHAQVAPILEPYRVDEHGGGLGIFLDQTAVFVTAGPQRWVAERTRHDKNWCGAKSGGKCKQTDVRSHDWIDSADCPQLIDILRDLSVVTPPRFASPDVTDYWIASDTTMLTIAGRRESAGPMQGVGGEEGMLVREESGPYRKWWTKAEASLKGCWKPQAPLVDGKPAAPRLAEQS